MIRVLSLMMFCLIGCQKAAPPAPRDYVREYQSSSDPPQRQQGVQGLLKDSSTDIDSALMKIDQDDELTAIDSARNVVFHNRERNETYFFAPGRSYWNYSKSKENIKEVRWLGNAPGKPFGFPHQEYSLFLAQHETETSYQIIFIIKEPGQPIGMNMGLLTDPHYQILSDLGVWPEDWKYEAGNSQIAPAEMPNRSS